VDGFVDVQPVGDLPLKGMSHPISTVNVVGLRDGAPAIA
jgi:hypothetical protein